MSAGHPDAPLYPVHRVWEEARLVTQRENNLEASRALVLQMTVLSVLTGSKDAQSAFKDMIEGLKDDD